MKIAGKASSKLSLILFKSLIQISMANSKPSIWPIQKQASKTYFKDYKKVIVLEKSQNRTISYLKLTMSSGNIQFSNFYHVFL